MTKPNDDARELNLDELNAVTGGAGQTQSAPVGAQQLSNADRRKSGLDNIQKLLDVLHGMNPKI